MQPEGGVSITGFPSHSFKGDFAFWPYCVLFDTKLEKGSYKIMIYLQRQKGRMRKLRKFNVGSLIHLFSVRFVQ